eukprot:PhF_6_TR30745/c0_g1_i1/m.45257
MVDVSLVVYDEGHRLRNTHTQRWTAAEKVRADCRLFLSGTPMQNHLREYCNMLMIVQPGLWSSAEFEKKYERPILIGQMKDANGVAVRMMNRAVSDLQHQLSKVVHRKGPEILQSALPPQSVMTLLLIPSVEDTQEYNTRLILSK